MLGIQDTVGIGHHFRKNTGSLLIISHVKVRREGGNYIIA